MIAVGLEGSANKLGVGIIKFPPSYNFASTSNSTQSTTTPPIILSNLRHTYNSPPGEGFLPKITAQHHRAWIVRIVKQAMRQARISIDDVSCICYTRGPGMGAPLQSVAVVARTLALLWDKDLVDVNHCIGRESSLLRIQNFMLKNRKKYKARYEVNR